MLPPVHSREGGRRGRRSRYAGGAGVTFFLIFHPSRDGASFAPHSVVCPAHKFWNNYSCVAPFLWSCFAVLLLGIDLILRVRARCDNGLILECMGQRAPFARGNLTVDDHAHKFGNHLLSHKLTACFVLFHFQVNTKNWSALEHISSYGQCNRSQAGSLFACSSLTSYARRKLKITCSYRWGLQCSTRW